MPFGKDDDEKDPSLNNEGPPGAEEPAGPPDAGGEEGEPDPSLVEEHGEGEAEDIHDFQTVGDEPGEEGAPDGDGPGEIPGGDAGGEPGALDAAGGEDGDWQDGADFDGDMDGDGGEGALGEDGGIPGEETEHPIRGQVDGSGKGGTKVSMKVDPHDDGDGHMVHFHDDVSADLRGDADYQHHATEWSKHQAGYHISKTDDPERAEAHRHAANLHARIGNALHAGSDTKRERGGGNGMPPGMDPALMGAPGAEEGGFGSDQWQDGEEVAFPDVDEPSPGNDALGEEVPSKPDMIRNNPMGDTTDGLRSQGKAAPKPPAAGGGGGNPFAAKSMSHTLRKGLFDMFTDPTVGRDMYGKPIRQSDFDALMRNRATKEQVRSAMEEGKRKGAEHDRQQAVFTGPRGGRYKDPQHKISMSGKAKGRDPFEGIPNSKLPPQERRRRAKAGGPFIGPKGGKWADPQHKIPWTGDKGKFKWEKDESGGKMPKNLPTKQQAALAAAVKFQKISSGGSFATHTVYMALRKKGMIDSAGKPTEMGRKFHSILTRTAPVKRHSRGEVRRQSEAHKAYLQFTGGYGTILPSRKTIEDAYEYAKDHDPSTVDQLRTMVEDPAFKSHQSHILRVR